MNWPFFIIALVAIQRLGELVYSAHNADALKAAGAIEVGAGHYSLLVGVHAAWLLALFAGTDAATQLRLPWLVLFLLLQIGRVWTLHTLGGYWTTRLFHLANVPKVRSGPYRLLRHPNYVIVAGEIATLPLVFGLWGTALVFFLLNGAVLLWRMRIENNFLDRRP